MNKAATFSLPESVLKLVNRVQEERRDPTRSDTVRVLLLQALAAMNYLPQAQKKALGIKPEVTGHIGGEMN
jgi:metal-responsive CopG/Arc/MetJ family transcriptional regulator